jgi:hypothetical protein
MVWVLIVAFAVFSVLTFAWGRLVWKMLADDDFPKPAPRESHKSDRPWELF